MKSNSIALKRLNELNRAQRGQLSEPCQKYWNEFIASPLFDELQLVLEGQIEVGIHAPEAIHQYAHEMGRREGFRQCIQFLRLGAPDASSTEATAKNPIDVFSKKPSTQLA